MDQPPQPPGGPAGIAFRRAHYPGRAPIDAYGGGGFRFAEMSHRGSIICVPSGIYGWDARQPADLTEDAFARVIAEAGEIDLLLVGTGPSLRRLDDAVTWRLRGVQVRPETMATGAAVRTFNVLLAEERRVAAALLVVE